MPNASGISSPVQLLTEANRLLTYASERHLLAPADATQAKNIEQNVVLPLTKTMREYRIDPNETTRNALLLAYARLTALTGAITGRSLADSETSDRRLLELFVITVVTAIAAITLSAYSISNPDQAPLTVWQTFTLYAGLFFWGAFGSGLYLLKMLSDRIAEGSFDSRLLQGHRARILLGAALAAVVPRLFNLGPKGIDVDAVAVAVLTGLGVKVVNGAIENLVEALSEKFNLGNLRPTQPSAAPLNWAALPPLGGAADGSAAPTAPQSAPSALAETQRLLAGLGRYSGPMDGQLNASMLAALRDYLGDNATDDEIRSIRPALLVQWLRVGERPDNWRDQMADPNKVKVAASRSPKEVAANLAVLPLLQARQWTPAAVNTQDPMAVELAVNSGLQALIATFPDKRGYSFTQLVKLLQQAGPAEYTKAS